MKPHKWHDEIVAWASGAEIECRRKESSGWSKWETFKEFYWMEGDLYEYRIKPQPQVNKFSHIPYWLCCGSLHQHHHYSSCSEAKAGNPERCRFGTVEEHQKRMEKSQPKKDEIEKEWNRRMAEKALAIPEISDAVDRLFEAFAVKEPQYLYVYGDLSWDEQSYKLCRKQGDFGTYIGKIKLED
jgi:hypothetical protein